MNIYQNRVSTFINWPKNESISVLCLARAGFIYEGKGNEVRCFSCGLAVSNFPAEFVPIDFHRENNNNCMFLQSINNNNTSGVENTLENNVLSNLEENGKTQQHLDITQSQPDSYDTRNVNVLLNLSVDNDISWIGNNFGAAKNPQFISIKNRLKSFRSWSYRNIKEPMYFVDAGFFYTGKEDIVRCFFCDIGIAEWVSEDDPWVEHARHSQKCLFLIEKKGSKFIKDIQTERRQIYCPKHNEFEELKDRIRSFFNWPSKAQQPEQLASAGFYYTGEKDIVRCFFCDIGLKEWVSEDDPWAEHARHSENCLFLIEKRGSKFIKDIQTEWRQVYCPKHSEFEELNDRVRSFINWPSLAQQPEQLALAGFYYTGNDDIVRCHYCDGGLRNWEEGDLPWSEHARCFPFCKFLLKMKGPDYIKEIAKKYGDFNCNTENKCNDSSSKTGNENGQSREESRDNTKMPLNGKDTDTANSMLRNSYPRHKLNDEINEYKRKIGEESRINTKMPLNGKDTDTASSMLRKVLSMMRSIFGKFSSIEMIDN